MLVKSFLLVILAIAISLFILFRPSYVSEVNCQGTIKIERDEYGIATLHVNSISQYLYGLGTIYAEDRLFQLTFRTYLVQGRLSEFVGARLLDHDKYMHELNLKGWAQKRVERMLRENKSEYEAYNMMVQGINKRVAEMTVLPLDFYLTGIKWENFTVNHIFYLEIFMEWGISMNLLDQYKRSLLLTNFTKQEIDWILPNKRQNWAFNSVPIVLDEQIPDHLRTQNLKHRLQKIRFDPLSVQRPLQLQIIQAAKQFDATNVLVVSGNHTQTGLPLLVNDPHLQNIIPSQWYLLRVNYTKPDGRNLLIAGGLVTGGIKIIGQNGYYVMGVSICHGDNQDLYREKIEGDKYLLDGTWRDLKIRNESVYVKTSEGLVKQEFQVRQTHRGPIISYIYGNGGSLKIVNDFLSIAWTGFNSQWQDSISFMRIFLSQTVQDLRGYLQNSTLTLYNLNLLAATRDNHIMMQQTGLNPLRRNPQSGTYIKDGSTTFHDWVGIVPAQGLMHLVDPPKGYIINSNNRVGQAGYYGGYLTHNTYTARADRIDELVRAQIKSGRKIGAQFMKSIIYDTVDIYCRQILPQILEVVEGSRQFLKGFDCNFSSTSFQATIYQVFFTQLFYQIRPIKFEKIPFLSSYFMQQGIYNYIHFAFKGDQSKKQTLKAAWSNTLPYLQSHFKTKDYTTWSWGKLHVDKTKHIPFRNVPWLSYFYDLEYPGSGNMNTPNMGKMEKQDFDNFQTTHRAVIRMMHGFGEEQNYFCVDSGQSEHITSSHYYDQWKLFTQNQLIPINLNHKNEYANDL